MYPISRGKKSIFPFDLSQFDFWNLFNIFLEKNGLLILLMNVPMSYGHTL